MASPDVLKYRTQAFFLKGKKKENLAQLYLTWGRKKKLGMLEIPKLLVHKYEGKE